MNDIQLRELDVFKEVVKVIKKHNLRYFAVGGTCIGAIRHKGFIPWDDDIDIALPREDYEKLRNDYYKELPNHISKLDYDSCESHGYLFYKFHDNRTTFVEEYAVQYPDRYTGVFVDIMPIDGLPDDKNQSGKVLKKLSRLCSLNSAVRPMKYNQNSLMNSVKSAIRFSLRKTHRYNYYSNKICALMSSYSFDNSHEIVFTWRINDTNCFPTRVIYNKKMFIDTIEMEFEDTTIRVPVGYDEYLKQDFGDYMTLPPVEQRNSIHSVCICDMNRTFKYYAEKKEGKM